MARERNVISFNMVGFLKEYRCRYCKKLFFKGDLFYGTIEIKCRNCKNISEIKGTSCKVLLAFDQDSSYRRSDGSLLSKTAITKTLAQCPKCKNADYCGYYRIMKGDEARPFYRKA